MPLNEIPDAGDIDKLPKLDERTPEDQAHNFLENAKQELSYNLERVMKGDWNFLRIKVARNLLQVAAARLDNHDDEKAAMLRQAAVNLTRWSESYKDKAAADADYSIKADFSKLVDDIKLLEV